MKNQLLALPALLVILSAFQVYLKEYSNGYLLLSAGIISFILLLGFDTVIEEIKKLHKK